MCDPVEQRKIFSGIYLCINVCMCIIISFVLRYTSLTVKGAGHGGCVGTKQLGGIGLGAFLFHVSIDTLQRKAKSASQSFS